MKKTVKEKRFTKEKIKAWWQRNKRFIVNAGIVVGTAVAANCIGKTRGYKKGREDGAWLGQKYMSKLPDNDIHNLYTLCHNTNTKDILQTEAARTAMEELNITESDIKQASVAINCEFTEDYIRRNWNRIDPYILK